MRWKATRFAVVFLGVLALAMPSFAEVQNVKVGGDITVRAFHRENKDLSDCETDGTTCAAAAATFGLLNTEDDFLMSTVGVNVGADLTENVSSFIRLASERDWNNDPGSTNGAAGDFDLSQAYIKLHEFLYSPLTLTIGQQPIRWGRGFVLGSSFIPGVLGSGGDRNTSIAANEYTDFSAFDAIRATLDLSNLGAVSLPPLSLDMVYIKLDENVIGKPDDVNLVGFNLSSRLSDDAEMEAYYINKRDKSTDAGTAFGGGDLGENDGSVSTVGIRGSVKPMDAAVAWGELAYQFGRRAADPAGVLPGGDSQQAWAFDLGIEWTFADAAWTPKLGWEWIFWSGKDSDNGINGWDPIARGYYTTALREFQTDIAGGFYGTRQAGDTSAATNQHQVAWFGSVNPVEDVTIAPRVTLFWQDTGAVRRNVAGARIDGERSNYAGVEVDTQVLYNYTDDVQLGLLYALFAPGSVYRYPNDNTAQELVTSVSLKF